MSLFNLKNLNVYKHKVKNNSSNTKRKDMVGQNILKILSMAMAKGLLINNLRYKYNTTITISEVDISPDLTSAKVFFIISNEKDKEKILKEIDKENYKFRSFLANETNLRKVPVLDFCLDNVFYTASKIDNLIKTAKKR